jgi:hypothetical protein
MVRLAAVVVAAVGESAKERQEIFPHWQKYGGNVKPKPKDGGWQ